MASSSTSIARSRSLRKPTAGTSTDLSCETSTAASSASTGEERNISPSRLPAFKTTARAVSSAAAANQSDAQPAPAPASSAGTSSTFSKKSRPVSGAAHSRSGSVSFRSQHAQASKAKAQEGEEGQRPQHQQQHQQQQQHHPTRSRYPPSASVSGGFGAAAAVKRPTSSGGLPSQSKMGSGLQGPSTAGGPSSGGRTLGHARAKSTTTATTTASRERGALLSDAPVLRPPAQPASSSSTSGVGPKARPTSTYARPPSANEGPNPSKTTVAHAASTITANTSTARSSPSEAAVPSKPMTQATPRLSRKPAFTTHQQHFSPLRRQGPKPPTASYLAPPSPSKAPANVAASAETVRLQTELLQLHLLHKDAAETDATWRASAKQKLGQHHADLARRDEEVRDAEREAEETENVAALRAWGDGGGRARSGGIGLEEKVQVLDAVLSGLWGIEGPGGRYARVVRRFERWCDGFVEVEAARREAENHAERNHGRGGQLEALLRAGLSEEDIFVGGLDGAWKDEVAGFARRLEGWGRQLRSLGDFSPAPGESDPDADVVALEQSSLGRILQSCDSLIRDKLAELDVMEGIERAAVERERRWIREMICGDEEENEGRGERADEDSSRGRNDTPRAGAIWRVV